MHSQISEPTELTLLNGLEMRMSIRRYGKFKDDTVKSSLYKTRFGFKSGFGAEKFSYDLPWVIKPSEKYIFFLHGKLVEKQGPNARHACFGIYDYHGIVNAFINQGFTVISEMRPKGTKLYKYSANIVRQIKTLLAHGIPPEQITVVGFSKGNAIALLISAALKNPGVNFVVMSGISYTGTHVPGCYKKLIDRSVQFLQGRFLSIYDESDQGCDFCQKIFQNISDGAIFKEIKVKNGLGHGLFYRPRKDWFDPVVEWIKKQPIISPYQQEAPYPSIHQLWQ